MHKDFLELVERVEKLANDELERANKEYPLFNSLHEGYAVLMEEIDEAIKKNQLAMASKEKMWLAIKEDLKSDAIKYAYEAQKYLAESTAEMVQCIAMCRKIIESEADRCL